MKRASISLGFILVFVLSCFAADLTGTWKGTVPFQGNQLELTYKFKADGEKLTGSVTSSFGELPISEGKISGTDFSYKIDTQNGSIESTGKYYTDSIVITTNIDGNALKNTFKRVVE